MPKITAGRVVYRSSIQPQPYENETAEVELHFRVDDDEDPADAAAEVLDVARQEVEAALGIKRSKPKRA